MAPPPPNNICLEASISEVMEAGALQGDQVPAVAGEGDQGLVREGHTVGDAEVPGDKIKGVNLVTSSLSITNPSSDYITGPAHWPTLSLSHHITII